MIGLPAGILAGMLGVGGGIILVPALFFVFQQQDLSPDIAMPLAVGTSLATIVVTNTAATLNHNRRDAVLWRWVGKMLPGIMAGAWLGAFSATALQGEQLRMLFGLFEISVAIHLFYHHRKPEHGNFSRKKSSPSSKWLPSFAGVLIGWISALFGIGGGTLTVPMLTLGFGLPIHAAIGTASAIGIAIALFGASGFVVTGLGAPSLPDNTVGWIALPALFGIVSGTLLTTPIGVQWAHRLPTERLKKIFALMLLLLGVKITLG